MRHHAHAQAVQDIRSVELRVGRADRRLQGVGVLHKLNAWGVTQIERVLKPERLERYMLFQTVEKTKRFQHGVKLTSTCVMMKYTLECRMESGKCP